MEALAQVHEIEDVFLEAAAAKADARLEELGAHARVVPDGVSDLVDVGAGGLADGGESVDGGDALREHGVGGELRELGGPEADGEDLGRRDPVGVNASERGARVLALGGLQRTDEDAVGLEEVGDGGALGEELGVGEDIKVAARLGVCLEDSAHRFGCAAWHGRLFHDNLGGRRDRRNLARCQLHVAGEPKSVLL